MVKIMGSNMENPLWKQQVLDRIEARRKATRHGGAASESTRTTTELRARVRVPWLDMVHRIAAAKGISTSTYVRRVLSVSMAAETGRDVREFLALCVAPAPPKHLADGTKRLMPGDTIDDGTGIEEFCPHPGCDGEHLR